jgi:hypothetical protein
VPIHELDPDIPAAAPSAPADLPDPITEIVEAWPRMTDAQRMEVYRLALQIAREQKKQ